MYERSFNNVEVPLTFPWLFEGGVEGTRFLMDGSWGDCAIDFPFFLAEHDVELGVICAVEANDLATAWRIGELADFATREGFRFVELFLRRSYKGWASEMRSAVGRLRCDVDVWVLSISSEVQVVTCLRSKDEAEVLSELAELLKVGVFKVHMA